MIQVIILIAKRKQSSQLNKDIAPVFKKKKIAHDVHNEEDTDLYFRMQVFKQMK